MGSSLMSSADVDDSQLKRRFAQMNQITAEGVIWVGKGLRTTAIKTEILCSTFCWFRQPIVRFSGRARNNHIKLSSTETVAAWLENQKHEITFGGSIEWWRRGKNDDYWPQLTTNEFRTRTSKWTVLIHLNVIILAVSFRSRFSGQFCLHFSVMTVFSLNFTSRQHSAEFLFQIFSFYDFFSYILSSSFWCFIEEAKIMIVRVVVRLLKLWLQLKTKTKSKKK